MEKTNITNLKNVRNNLYFNLHCNPRKILRRARLNYIAKFLDSIDGYNLLGSTPSEILEMPLELIEKFNSEIGIRLIINESRRRKISDIFYKYPVVFSYDFNETQCKYFDMFLTWEREFMEEDKEILEELHWFDLRYADKCVSYYEKREMLKLYIDLPILSFNNNYTETLFLYTTYYWHEIFGL